VLRALPARYAPGAPGAVQRLQFREMTTQDAVGRVLRTGHRKHCTVCSNTGWVSISWFRRREAVCTCGAGDPADEMIFHTVDCDSVVCPFDQLLVEAA
jgi:hypothetical protein